MIDLVKLAEVRDKFCKEKEQEKIHPDRKEGYVNGAMDMWNAFTKAIKEDMGVGDGQD